MLFLLVVFIVFIIVLVFIIVVVFIIIVVVFIVLFLFLFFICFHRRKRGQIAPDERGEHLAHSRQLRRIAKNTSVLLWKGFTVAGQWHV